MMVASLKKILIATPKLCSEEMNTFANRLDFYIVTPSSKYLSLNGYYRFFSSKHLFYLIPSQKSNTVVDSIQNTNMVW